MAWCCNEDEQPETWKTNAGEIVVPSKPGAGSKMVCKTWK